MSSFFFILIPSTIIFTFMVHPMSAGVILLIQTIIISMITGILNYNFWFSYIMFLIMVGGMLVLFIYMTSIASNEKFSTSNSTIMIMLMTIILSTLMATLIKNNKIELSMMEYKIWNTEMTLPLSKFFIYPAMYLLLLMIIYLFISLIAIVKISDSKYGPIRQKF